MKNKKEIKFRVTKPNTLIKKNITNVIGYR